MPLGVLVTPGADAIHFQYLRRGHSGIPPVVDTTGFDRSPDILLVSSLAVCESFVAVCVHRCRPNAGEVGRGCPLKVLF